MYAYRLAVYCISLNCLKYWCWFYNSEGFKKDFDKGFIMPEGEKRKYV